MKMNIKKKVALTALLVISHAVFFTVGSVVNRQAMMKSLSSEFSKSNARVNLGRYAEYRDIVIYINDREFDKAMCSAQLGASAMYDDLKSCLSNLDCKAALEQEVRNVAPEMLGDAQLKFKYLEIKDGIRTCE